MIRKEFIQLKRDRMTFAMLIGIPMMQLTLFGYAINADPKLLPAAIVQADDSDFSRSVVRGERPSVLLEVDATDPIAIGPAIAAVQTVTATALNRDLTGSLQDLRGVVLTLTLVMLTVVSAVALKRYRATLD